MFASILRLSLTALVIYGVSGYSNALANEAPDFSLEGKHSKLKLSDYRGQVVYLDFWASWCQPCRDSFAWMNNMQSRYGQQGLKIIAINLDEARENADRFLTRVPAEFAVAFDPEANTAESYRIKAMPSSFIIDKNGQMIYANHGFAGKDLDKLEAKILTTLQRATVASRQQGSEL